jgi:hypothetical protein
MLGDAHRVSARLLPRDLQGAAGTIRVSGAGGEIEGLPWWRSHPREEIADRTALPSAHLKQLVHEGHQGLDARLRGVVGGALEVDPRFSTVELETAALHPQDRRMTAPASLPLAIGRSSTQPLRAGAIGHSGHGRSVRVRGTARHRLGGTGGDGGEADKAGGD